MEPGDLTTMPPPTKKKRKKSSRNKVNIHGPPMIIFIFNNDCFPIKAENKPGDRYTGMELMWGAKIVRYLFVIYLWCAMRRNFSISNDCVHIVINMSFVHSHNFDFTLSPWCSRQLVVILLTLFFAGFIACHLSRLKWKCRRDQNFFAMDTRKSRFVHSPTPGFKITFVSNLIGGKSDIRSYARRRTSLSFHWARYWIPEKCCQHLQAEEFPALVNIK